jgi:hypothetical protein
MKDNRKSGRATIKKFESKGNYDPEDMAMIKQTFFETYKEDFKEEQYLEVNPFDLSDDDTVDHEESVQEVEV